MKAIPKPWIVLNLSQFAKKINFNPPYQRQSGKWAQQKNQRLIDSILRNYDLPKFYLAPSSIDGFEWEVVDGQEGVSLIRTFEL